MLADEAPAPTAPGRARGIKAVIPERGDQTNNRRRRGRRGGRSVGYDIETYKRRNVVKRSFNVSKNWRGLATRYDKLALTYHDGVVLAAAWSGYAHWETRPTTAVALHAG